MRVKLKNILKTLSEQEGDEVVSIFEKLKQMNVNNVNYRQLKMAAISEIRAALKSDNIMFLLIVNILLLVS